jgi:integrase
VFREWCQAQGHDSSAVTVELVLSFLSYLFREKGAAASTLTVYVAALGAFLGERAGGGTLGSDRRIILLLRGARRQRPPARPIVPKWDLQLVLNSLMQGPYEPPDRASVAQWSRKTAFLVALCSGARGGELAGLGALDRVHLQDDCATLRPAPGFVPKVGSARNVNRVIRLVAYSPETATRRRGEDYSLLCPLRALRIYLDKTRRVRRCDRLFVAYAAWREGQPIRAPTMATWLRQVIIDAYVVAGIPAPLVRAHSIRATATSLAELGGASMEDICEAATWAGPNTFARHYRMGLHRGGYSGITRNVLNAALRRARRQR